MMDNLVSLGYGIVAFAVVVVIGTVIVFRMGNSVGGTANTTAQYFVTQLGTTGLAGWTGAIIAFAIGIMFLGYFVANKR